VALVATAMQALMVGRALSQTLFDKPPHYALSRVYGVLAKGVVNTLIDPAAVIVTVAYTGFAIVPPPPWVGLGTGWSNLDQDRFYPAVQTLTLHAGPLSVPFYFGVGGIVEYLKLAPVMTDLLPLTGVGGTGTLISVILDPVALFDNIKAEAEAEGIMVVDVTTHLGGNPLGTIPDPTTGILLSEGDLFVQAEALIQGVATQLPVELLFATNSAIVTTGAVGIVPVAGATTITTLIS